LKKLFILFLHNASVVASAQVSAPKRSPDCTTAMKKDPMVFGFALSGDSIRFLVLPRHPYFVCVESSFKGFTRPTGIHQEDSAFIPQAYFLVYVLAHQHTNTL
jgi:hypothetical protein